PCLVGTDVTCCFVTSDVLFACLQSQYETAVAFIILCLADKTPRHFTHQFAGCSEITAVRAAELCRDTEYLYITCYDICTEFARRRQHAECKRVAVYNKQSFMLMCNLFNLFQIFHRTEEIWILYHYRGCIFVGSFIKPGEVRIGTVKFNLDNFNVLSLAVCSQYFNRLIMDTF